MQGRQPACGGRRQRSAWAAALACALWLALPAAQSRADPPAATRAEAFDATLARLQAPASLNLSSDAYEAELQRLRVLLPAGDRAREARMRAYDCGSLRWQDAQAGLAYSEQAVALARALHDRESEARALLCQAVYLGRSRGSVRALPLLGRAIALLDDGRFPRLQAEALELRGSLLSELGEQARALLDFQRARRLPARRHPRRGRAAAAAAGGQLPPDRRLGPGRAPAAAAAGAAHPAR